MKKKGSASTDIGLVTSPRVYFSDAVEQALKACKVKAAPMVSTYLVELLETNVTADKLALNSTMAELLLKSFQAERNARIDLLKRLGDTSLYVSGFFGDSLRRKIVDIDYYAEIGGMAYSNLAQQVENDLQAEIFNEFASHFLEYVDVLTCISQKSMIQTNQDILRLYERYIATGSELAKNQLAEKGILAAIDKKKSSQ